MNLALSSLHGDWRITLEMTLKVPLRNQTVVFVLEIRDKLQARIYYILHSRFHVQYSSTRQIIIRLYSGIFKDLLDTKYKTNFLLYVKNSIFLKILKRNL